MKKKSIASVIFRTFFKAIGVMSLLIAVGFAGYFLTMFFYKITTRSEKSTTYEHVIDVTTGNDSRNLIYSYDEKSKLINRVVLEIYHSDTSNLDYVTIPSGTEIETSAETYAEMLKKSQEVPQIIRLSRLNRYFNTDIAYEFGIMALEEEMGTKIGYFTAIPSQLFDELFENRGTKEEPHYAPSKAILDKAKACKDSYELSDLVDDYWNDLSSDITYAQRCQYSAGLKKVNPDYIHTYYVVTEKVKKTYHIITQKAKELFKKLDQQDEYTSADSYLAQSAAASSNVKNITDSKKLKIQITNGTKINGLAASYKEKLEREGYLVQGVGDYSGEVMVTTKILVKKKGIGDDLLSYFSAATIEVTSSSLADNADIEIILGTKDRITGY